MDIWEGKNKAFTMSYDDGIRSDNKFLDIINYYGLKCTFNLNSGKLGSGDVWDCKGFGVVHQPLEGIKNKYAGHEIAVHGYTHVSPVGLGREELDKEFLRDKNKLNEIFGTEPVGMAYAFGDYDDSVVDYLKSIGVKYGRTVWDSYGFDVQEDLLRFRPTCHHTDYRVMELLEEFIEKEDDKPQLFYLWGHSYEFDADRNWTKLEQICEKISGYDNIFYGTNREVFGL